MPELSALEDLYGGSLALLTDLYQLTMAYGYWKAGAADREAVFHLTFRRAPFGGGYAIAGGIAQMIGFLRRLAFSPDDLAYLSTLRDGAGAPLFIAGSKRGDTGGATITELKDDMLVGVFA